MFGLEHHNYARQIIMFDLLYKNIRIIMELNINILENSISSFSTVGSISSFGVGTIIIGSNSND